MAFNKYTIGTLLYKKQQGLITGEEEETLKAWANLSDDNLQLLAELDKEEILQEKLQDYHPENRQEIRSRILARVNNLIDKEESLTPVVHRVHFLRKWGWVAAAVILFIGFTAIYLGGEKKRVSPVAQTENTTPILPGKNGAILTLSDGSEVILDDHSEGLIAKQNGSTVSLQDGKIQYTPDGKPEGKAFTNTMSTPKGRQFQMTLPDGTKVWLNAASSITYPTAFNEKERLVKITGEIYMEVAKNAKQPFRVNIPGNLEMEILGTSFNINAYPEEDIIKTVLVEGSVRISKGQERITLKPGQQAEIDPHDLPDAQIQIRVTNGINLNKILAWKNGFFFLEGSSLKEIMRQVARWYDIEVTYEKGWKEVAFVGQMSNDATLNDWLVALEKSDVKYKIEGRNLIIQKQ